ncbi:MAG: energy transducer TonB [Verrucomicrobiaceae bacterium]|nr:energy transducer TonB [Verrucomicrobiaceae bacterium]
MSPETLPKPTARLAWRFRVLQDVPVALCWLLALSSSFLTVGIAGIFAADMPEIRLKTLADLTHADDLPLIETTMAELQSQNTEEPAPAEDAPPETPEILEIEIPDEPPPDLDLPEVAEAMTQEDIFAIPTAPKIEDALKRVDPVVQPAPKPTPAPRKATASRTPSRPSTTPGTPGGTPGGTGTATRSSGRMITPAPPYPSFAKAQNMQGTVRLSLSVGPSGAVEGATVISSTGFSALDSYAASWVRRNWRFPATGAGKRYTLPLSFRLR